MKTVFRLWKGRVSSYIYITNATPLQLSRAIFDTQQRENYSVNDLLTTLTERGYNVEKLQIEEIDFGVKKK